MPTEAAIVQASPPSRDSETTSLTRSSVGRNPAIRRISQSPTTASRVLPTPMRAAVPRGRPRVISATTTPASRAGHIRIPKIARAASAMPLGGHTAVTVPATSAREAPRLAAPTYAAMIAMPARA